MCAKLNFTDLSQAFNGFINPIYSISINGTEIDRKYCGQEIEIELTAGYEASFAKFIIRNAFLIKKGENTISTTEDLSSVIKLGNAVKVKIGYVSKLYEVFSGYIDSIYVDYDKEEGIYYSIECLDGKGIMMNSIHSETKKSINKLSLAAEDVLKKYSSLLQIKSSDIDKSDTEVTVPIEQHNESDYEFVVRLAKKLNYDFYVEKGCVYFKAAKKRNKSVIVDYHINEFVRSFNFNYSLKNIVKSVTVRGNNENDPSVVFEGTALSYSNSSGSGTVNPSSITRILTDRVSRTIIDYSVSSESDAKQKAEAHLTELVFNLGKGQITTVGVPVVFPGYLVNITGFGSNYDRDYYVTKVKHKIQQNKFTTRCEIEVNKL